MRIGSRIPGIYLRYGATALTIRVPNRVVGYRNAETKDRGEWVTPGSGRCTDRDARRAAIRGPVVLAIDYIGSYFEKGAEQALHGAIRTRLLGKFIRLLDEDAVGIVLHVACDDGVYVLRPHTDRAARASATIAFLAEGLTAIDMVVNGIHLPEFTSDCNATEARKWNDVPTGCHSERGYVGGRVRRIADDFACLPDSRAVRDLYPMADIVARQRHVSIILTSDERRRHGDRRGGCLYHIRDAGQRERIGIVVEGYGFAIADLVGGTSCLIL